MRRRTGRPGDRQLRDKAVRGEIPEKLPLAHVTAVWWANEIIRDGKLETRRCSVFNKELLYFFVLRPAYRDSHSDQKSHQLSRFPVVFIVKADAVVPPYHVYPFDTGGALAGAFASQADPYIPIEDYELEPTLAAAAGHIGWAFETANSYYEGDLKSQILEGVPAFETVVHGFVDIARMGRVGSNQHDKRASAIEIAVAHDVDLKDNVLLAIVPKQYLEAHSGTNIEVMQRLSELNIEITTYNWQPNSSPQDFQDQINHLAKDWYKAHGWL